MMTSVRPSCAADGRYSVSCAASMLGISRATLYRYINAGDVKTKMRKVTKKLFLTGSEIIRIWEQSW